MRSKIANRCLNLSQQHSIPCRQEARRSLTHVALAYRFVHRPAMFGMRVNVSESSRKCCPIKRAVSVTASLDSEFSDEEFSKKIQELALRFQVSDDTDTKEDYDSSKLPDWPGDMNPASIERKANSVDLPFSLRIIKKKKQWQEGLKEASESAYCSVKKAFSSMVFIIRELQSYTLHMREHLFYEDLQEILVRVQKEMNASFVWLFQQVFSQTPTLMVYVMILLANYSVHSMSNSFAHAAGPPPAATETVVHHHTSDNTISTRIDTSTFKSFKSFKTTSVGGNNGGGGKLPGIASGTDGEGWFPTRVSEESVSGQVSEDEEWKMVVYEADKMQDVIDGLDHETMKRFVAPVSVTLTEEDTEDYLKTEQLYQTGLSQEPNNPLLLANYAQFLYLVARDYDRAEDYFKRASIVEPKDAEALNKYASFLWQCRNDLWAAEETYLEAISADPNNSFYAANYAHFLWSTGGEDTCFPLDAPENSFSSDM